MSIRLGPELEGVEPQYSPLIGESCSLHMRSSFCDAIRKLQMRERMYQAPKDDAPSTVRVKDIKFVNDQQA
jgi:hypothetical protein